MKWQEKELGQEEIIHFPIQGRRRAKLLKPVGEWGQKKGGEGQEQEKLQIWGRIFKEGQRGVRRLELGVQGARLMEGVEFW